MKNGKSVTIAIIVIAVSWIIAGCATTETEGTPVATDKYPLQVVEDCPLVMQAEIVLPGTMDELYFLADDWITFDLAETEEDILYWDADAGIIAGRGTIDYRSGGDDYVFEYEFSVESADRRVLATIVCPHGVRNFGSSDMNIMMMIEPHLMPSYDYKKIKKQLNAVAVEFVSSMELGYRALKLNEEGIAKAESGDVDGAIADFSEAIEIYPRYYRSYDSRGIAYRMRGDFPEALADHDKALDLSYGWYAVYANRGTTRLMMGDTDGAAMDYTTAIEMNPDDYRTYMMRSQARSILGDPEGAAADLENAIAIYPDDHRIYFVRSQMRSNHGDYEGALSDLDVAYEYNPEDPDGHNIRGWIYVKQGHYQDAVSELDKALAVRVDEAYYETRGWACFFLDMREEARQDARNALELEPELSAARALLYRIEVQEGRTDEASRSLRDYLLRTEQKPVEDDYYLVLRYFAGEVSLDTLENHRLWDDLRVALRGYE